MNEFNVLVRTYWPITLVVVSLLGWVVTAWLSTKFATKKEMNSLKVDVEGIEETLEDHGKEILGIRKDIEHLPTIKQFFSLEVKISKLEEQSKSNGGMLKEIYSALMGSEGKKP